MRGLLAGVVGAVREAGVERVTVVTGIDLKGYETWDDRDLPWNDALAAAIDEIVHRSARRDHLRRPAARFAPRTSRSCSPRRRSAGSRSRERSTAAPTPSRCARPGSSARTSASRAAQPSTPASGSTTSCSTFPAWRSTSTPPKTSPGCGRPHAEARLQGLAQSSSAPRELLDFSVAAERLGLEIVAVSDHFQPLAAHRRPRARARCRGSAPLGERTERAQLGTSVLTPTMRYHPSMIAQAFATLALL